MYLGCLSLYTPKSLRATTMALSCYDSMYARSGVTTAPALPATTLAVECYNNMFANCSALETAPNLDATKLVQGCYNYMFYNCTSLKSIRALATNPLDNYTLKWTYGVYINGTFTKNAVATWISRNENGIPSNWTVQDYSI